MPLSIGIEYTRADWKTCLLENGQTNECFTFGTASSTLAYVGRLCALYPELTLALALPYEAPFMSLSALAEAPAETVDWRWKEIRDDQQAQEFLIAMQSINLHSYAIPSVRYIPTVPRHRAMRQSSLGLASAVCGAAALLYRLREREAAWPEMRFLLAQLHQDTRSIQVIFDGCLIDGLANDLDLPPKGTDGQLVELAMWEGLTRDLGGLMALHHVEDIILVGSQYEEAFNARFAEIYPVYLFPSSPKDIPGFEAALGAAILAEGLYLPGLAGEVVTQLGVREAIEQG